AVIYEKDKRWADCTKLLTPHRAKLGTTEGARILGQSLARDGKLEEAHALLGPYVEGRLERLHGAEASFESAQKNIITQLQAGQAPGFDYQRFSNAAKAEQGAILREYMQSRYQNDPGLKSAREALVREASVVPVAIDLGIVQLHRGQSLADPAAR